MSILTPTAQRVSAHTSPEINLRIQQAMRARVDALAKEGPAAMERRLLALDEEWDVERCLETGASSLILLGLTLGTAVDRKWLLLPAGVAGFLLQHALQGWCPPLPVFRRLGVRTADEINEERVRLRSLLGPAASASAN
jgi:hypothetical protein